MSNSDLEIKINKVIGANIRSLRRGAKVSQGELGRAVNVTFQQMQKYESGVNRVSAATLAVFAKKLNVNIQSFFFNDTREVVRPLEDRLLRVNTMLPRKAQRTLLTIANALQALTKSAER